MINEGIVTWKVLSSSRSVYISIFSIWKSIQSFIFCSAPGLTVAFDKRTNVQKPRKPQPHVAESSIFPRWFFFFFMSRLQKTARGPAMMIHRLCSICELRYCSNGCQNVISAVGSVLQWPLIRLRVHCWNVVLSISGGCNVNMFFSTSGSYCTGEISGVQMFNDLHPNKMISLGSHSWIMTPIKSHLSPLICNSYSSCSCT